MSAQPSDFHLAALSPEFVDPILLKPFWPESPVRPGLAELSDSIRHLGLLRPPLIWAEEGSLKLLAGRRRLAAVRSLGWTSLPVLKLPPDTPATTALALGLADNRERGFDPAETALIWRFLQQWDRDAALSLAPFLGLAPSPRLRDWCLAAAELPPKGLEALADGRLDLETGARLAAWPADDLEPVLDLFAALNPSKQKKREWLNWLEDIGRREKLAPRWILAAPEVAEALAAIESRGRPTVENELRRLLWRRRHPQLARLTDCREARLRALRLPPSVRLELDPSLEDLSFTLRLNFATPADFRPLADIVSALMSDPDFLKILDDAQDDTDDR